ncbi:MAG: hypothetical protein JHD32_05585 [Sphingobium sp.]|nr:hypothetical protein [Sphingobium sp.]
MVTGTTNTTGPINFPRDDIEENGRKVDAIASAIAPSLVFNAVAFPPNLPDHVRTALAAKADMARNVAAEAGFVRPTLDRPADGKTPEERAKDRDDQLLSYAAQTLEEIEVRRQREEASYQEWRQGSHTYAGQTMDGEDWHRAMNWFRDPSNVADWEDAMMAKTGQSRDEVRQTGGKMKRFYDLMEKDARGSMNADERAEFTKLNEDKDVKRGVEVQQEIQGVDNSVMAKMSERNEATLNGATGHSASSFAAALDDDGPATKLASVQSLTAVYKGAANGDAPLSPPATPHIAPPLQTVQVSPDNMFG